MTPFPTLQVFENTPWSHKTSSFVDSTEKRKYTDAVLKQELGSIYIDVPDFFKAFFGEVGELEEAAAAILERCKQENYLLSDDIITWRDWLETMQEKEVLRWFARTFDLLRKLASKHVSFINSRRILLTQHNRLSLYKDRLQSANSILASLWAIKQGMPIGRIS